MKHVVVTGGAGFIGSHIVDAYIERGYRVSVVDNLSTGNRRNVNPRAEFHEADLADFDIRPLRPDVVSHQAAQVDLRKSVDDPARDAEINVIASVRLLQQAHEAGVKRFILASTGGAIYGEPISKDAQTEEHPTKPLSPYGCAKLAVEHYMNYFRVVQGLPTVALRYANVYGPRQSAHGEAGVVAIFAKKMLAGQQVTINGTGGQTRDFVYVGDVVGANMAVTETADAGPFNVGTGRETDINELYAAMAKLIPNSPPAVHAPAKVGEQMRSVLAAKLRKAEVALPAGLAETVGWFRDHSR
jgi:UDP-glucose 4-epimerase